MKVGPTMYHALAASGIYDLMDGKAGPVGSLEALTWDIPLTTYEKRGPVTVEASDGLVAGAVTGTNGYI